MAAGLAGRTCERVGEARAGEEGVLEAGGRGADGERGLGVEEDVWGELIAALFVLLREEGRRAAPGGFQVDSCELRGRARPGAPPGGPGAAMQ